MIEFFAELLADIIDAVADFWINKIVARLKRKR
jgi:hypothetical protein